MPGRRCRRHSTGDRMDPCYADHHCGCAKGTGGRLRGRRDLASSTQTESVWEFSPPKETASEFSAGVLCFFLAIVGEELTRATVRAGVRGAADSWATSPASPPVRAGVRGAADSWATSPPPSGVKGPQISHAIIVDRDGGFEVCDQRFYNGGTSWPGSRSQYKAAIRLQWSPPRHPHMCRLMAPFSWP
jgi:hypothetical protein